MILRSHTLQPSISPHSSNFNKRCLLTLGSCWSESSDVRSQEINVVKTQNKSVFRYLCIITIQHCPHSPAAHHCCSKWPITPACWAHSSKPAAGTNEWTDKRKDGRTPYSFIDPAPHTMQAVTITCWRISDVEYIYSGLGKTESGKPHKWHTGWEVERTFGYIYRALSWSEARQSMGQQCHFSWLSFFSALLL